MLASFRTTALHVAASQGLEALTILYAQGLHKDDTPNSGGQYAIHAAAAAGNDDAVVYLLKNLGADINRRDGAGCTPAMLAVEHDHLNVVKVLLTRGADVLRSRDDHGSAALHYVKSPAMLQYIIANSAVPIDEVNGMAQTLLILAAKTGHADVVRCCLDRGAHLGKADIDGRTALHHASAQAHLEIVGDLLSKGASGAVVDKEGYTPLEVALVKQNVLTADLFYHYGTVFTKRQLLLYSILKREARLVQALEQEARHRSAAESAAESAASLTMALKLAVLHPNLSFQTVDGSTRPTLMLTSEELLEDLDQLRDPVPRPPGTVASATLKSVFSNMLRHSLSMPRVSQHPGVQPNRKSTGAKPEAAVLAAAHAAAEAAPQSASMASKIKELEGHRRTSLERMLPHYLHGLPARRPPSRPPSSQSTGRAAATAPKPGDATVPSTSGAAEGRGDADTFEDDTAATDMPTNILASLFFKQGKVSQESQRSNSFPTDMRTSNVRMSGLSRRVFSHAHPNMQRRRNPWGAAQEPAADSDENKLPPRHLKSMPHRQTIDIRVERGLQSPYVRGLTTNASALDLEQLHASKVEGMAEFEDMMARRMAIYHGVSERPEGSHR